MSRYTDEFIVSALQQADAETDIKNLCKKLGVLPDTFISWQKRYGGLNASDQYHLMRLERDVPRLKKLLDRLTVVAWAAIGFTVFFWVYTFLH